MSNNFDKIVKLACKPKNAPPKAKYVDVLISATYSDDGSLNDIIRSLSLRLREPNAVVVFKALLTLHQMIRAGSADNLLEHLSHSDVLRLRNVAGQSWEGYHPPSNLKYYASYLDSRIISYRDLKHDPVYSQTESNRRSNGLSANSKARRLRNLPVEKGLLREVKQIQRILDALVNCKFYDDDLREENTVLAYRMLVKDLLVLFQAGNEGVCNILEHYFEMSKIDATDAFEIYKYFIKQTDKIVDYLAIARRLHNVVNVPVPNLKHAPTSLVKALEEYLNDPDFENNRLEYKKSLGVVEGKGGTSQPVSSSESKAESKPAASSSSALTAAPTNETSTPSSSTTSAPPGASKQIQDFFDKIQADQQPTMFGGPATNMGSFSPQTQAQAQQQMQMQMQMQQMALQAQATGAPNPFRQSMMIPQQSGFMQPQMTGFPGMPQQQQQQFLQPQQTGAMAFGSLNNRQSTFLPATNQPFMQSQQTGFLQPQPTGANPFRQSVLAPLNTGAPFGGAGSGGLSGAFSQPASPFHASVQGSINRPGSTPAMASETKPLTAQPTGSKNPFAPAPGSIPSVSSPSAPRGPSMNELAMNRFNAQSNPGGSTSGSSATGSFDPLASSSQNTGGTGMSDIASAFTAETSKNNDSNPLAEFGSLSVRTNNFGTGSSAFSSAFGKSSTSSTSPIQAQQTGFLQPQRTGFGGSLVKPFKPSSTFGSSLMESLPPIPEPSPTQGVNGGTPNPVFSPGQMQTQQTGFPFQTSTASSPVNGTATQTVSGASAFGGSFSTGLPDQSSSPSLFAPQQGSMSSPPSTGGLNAQRTGFQPTSSFGQTLVAQTTGSGPNPFRQSMFGGAGGQQGMMGQQMTGMSQMPFGSANMGSGPFGSGSPFAGQNVQPQQQQNGSSLI